MNDSAHLLAVPTNQILRDAVADFEAIHRAYAKAGLLEYARPGAFAARLLGAGDDVYRFARNFLLASAMLRNRVARLVVDGGERRHVAVFGGNNVGKSAVVNIMVAAPVVSMSPEGGHTRHPHAVVGREAPLFGANGFAFQAFTAVAPEQLRKDRFDTYAVLQIESQVFPADLVLWDTPDCDSVGAFNYLEGVIETLATADLVIYVTSLDRYAVEHMVEWVFCLHEAGIPMIQALNRTEKRHREAVALKQRNELFPEFAALRNLPIPDPPIMPLRHLSGDEARDSDLWDPAHIEANALRDAVIAQARQTDRIAGGRIAMDFVLTRLEQLLAPIAAEVSAREGWVKLIEDELGKFVDRYRNDYLNAPGTIEPFTRLNLEFLRLLDPDIPGLNQALAALRWVASLPPRLIMTVGRLVYTTVLGGGTSDPDAPPPQLQSYMDAHVAMLNALGHHIADERKAAHHHPFWDVIDEEWSGQIGVLQKKFAAQVKEHMARTDHAIKVAAHDIYHEFEKHPKVLATLRGAKLTVTAGGLMLTFATFGKGLLVHDLLQELLVLPVMTFATDTGAGYLVRRHIEERRRALVQELTDDAAALADALYRQPLLALADRAMERAGALGIERAIFDRLPSRLQQLRAQLFESTP